MTFHKTTSSDYFSKPSTTHVPLCVGLIIMNCIKDHPDSFNHFISFKIILPQAKTNIKKTLQLLFWSNSSLNRTPTNTCTFSCLCFFLTLSHLQYCNVTVPFNSGTIFALVCFSLTLALFIYFILLFFAALELSLTFNFKNSHTHYTSFTVPVLSYGCKGNNNNKKKKFNIA